jgi:hypothetical protein
MTKLLDNAIETARSLPAELQDDIARMMLMFAGDDQSFADITHEEEAAVLRSREAAARGEFATDEQMQAIWTKHGL